MSARLLRAYVAAPFGFAPYVRSVLHPALRAVGFDPCSSWALAGDEPENLAALSLTQARMIRARNFADLDSAHLVVGFDPETLLPMSERRMPGGRETYVELGRAAEQGKAIVFVGAAFLTAIADDAFVVASVPDAIVAAETLYRMLTGTTVAREVAV